MADKIISINRNGELVYNNLNSDIKERAKSDNLFDKSSAAYLIMFLCFVVDAVAFYGRIMYISFDSPALLAAQMVGLLLCYDRTPIYLGIQHRKIESGLIKSNRFIFYIAITACTLGIVINTLVSIAALQYMTPAADAYVSGAVSSDSGLDSASLAVLTFNICLPLITSLVSYFISYSTYNPLQNLLFRYDMLINKKKDEIRRLEAREAEYKLINDPSRIADDVAAKYELKVKEIASKAIFYDNYVRNKLKSSIGNPSAISALSVDNTDKIVAALQHEMTVLNSFSADNPLNNP